MNQRTALVKGLGPLEATTLVVGGIVGTTVFLVTSDVAGIVGDPFLVLVTWLVAGLLSGASALCFAELAASMPHTGGTYVFIKRAYRSDMLAFSFGWMMCFAYATGAIAVVAILGSTYLMPVLQALGIIEGEYVTLGAVILIIVLAVLNAGGIRFGGQAQNVITALKLVLAVSVVGLAFVLGDLEFAGLFVPVDMPPVQSAIRDVSVALMLVLFSYSGAFFVTHIAEEIREPHRNIPRAIVVGFSIVLVLYLLLNVAYLAVLPFDEVTNARRIASDMMEKLVGSTGATFTSFIIFVSSVGVLNAQILNYPRIPFALARDGVFPAALGRINPRTGAPDVGILLIAAVATAFALTGSYSLILSYVAFVAHFFISLAVLAVIVMRFREPDLPRPFRVWGYPVTPVVFLLVSVVYLYNLLVSQPANVLVGVAIVLAGLPYYWFRRKAARRRTM